MTISEESEARERISAAYARGELPEVTMRSLAAFDANLPNGREPAISCALRELRDCQTLTERVRAVRALAIYTGIPIDTPRPQPVEVAPRDPACRSWGFS